MQLFCDLYFFRSMAQRSLSEQWRTEGNTIYVTAKIDLSPTVREARLQKAMSCFEKAQQTASSDDETASASKNIGMCSWRLATVSYTMGKQGFRFFFKIGGPK